MLRVSLFVLAIVALVAATYAVRPGIGDLVLQPSVVSCSVPVSIDSEKQTIDIDISQFSNQWLVCFNRKAPGTESFCVTWRELKRISEQ